MHQQQTYDHLNVEVFILDCKCSIWKDLLLVSVFTKMKLLDVLDWCFEMKPFHLGGMSILPNKDFETWHKPTTMWSISLGQLKNIKIHIL